MSLKASRNGASRTVSSHLGTYHAIPNLIIHRASWPTAVLPSPCFLGLGVYVAIFSRNGEVNEIAKFRENSPGQSSPSSTPTTRGGGGFGPRRWHVRGDFHRIRRHHRPGGLLTRRLQFFDFDPGTCMAIFLQQQVRRSLGLALLTFWMNVSREGK